MVNSLENIISRNCGRKVNASDVKGVREDRVTPYLGGQEDLALAGRVSKETIDFLTDQIHEIEKAVLKKVGLKERQAADDFKLLKMFVKGKGAFQFEGPL